MSVADYEFDPIDIDPIEIDLDFSIINFRIVGVYFGSVPGSPPDKNATGDIFVVTPRNPTVGQVLARVKQEANNGHITGVKRFDYNTQPLHSSNGDVLSRVEVEFTQKPKPGRPYPKGVYSLQQDLNSDPQHVFQYYIYTVKREQGQANELLRLNTDNKFIPLNQNKIEHGSYLVWRLVSIRKNHDYMAQQDDFGFGGLGDFFEAQMQTSGSYSPLERDVMRSDPGSSEPVDLPPAEEFPSVEEVMEEYEAQQ